jgi:NodT family efflux transporter outer membrane factor (OMF) lipoprotein
MGARRKILLLCAAGALTTACAVGPNYKRPAVSTSGDFKEQEGWKPSEPADVLTRGPWWEIFRDPVLSDLESQIEISNQNVRAAGAAVEQARALVQQAQAGFWPSLSLTFGRDKERRGRAPTDFSNTLTATGTWNIDVWGQIRRTVESDKASYQSSAAALAAAKLSAQAELAIDYFQLRAQDQSRALLDDIVDAEQKSLQITQSRYRTGVAAKSDVVTAQTQLLTSQAQQLNNAVQRGVLEHALAVLVGKEPAQFSIMPTSMRSDVPTVPAGVPSILLERRPDVAQAERRVAAANAQIGVAVAAWFPSLTLTGSGDYSGPTLGRLLRVTNQVWSVGPELAANLFDAGLRRAQVRGARAAYEVSVDNYRQTVLGGFQQVEDELVTLRVLEKEQVIEDEAVKAAKEAEELTLAQYKSGTVNYINVIQAQTTRLNAEETALNVLLGRLTASVILIEALGGGWDVTQIKLK